MEKSTISLYPCGDYDERAIGKIIERIGEAHPAFTAKLTPGARVFIKPNHLGVYPATSAVNTHPAVLAAVIHYLKNFNVSITVGDSLSGKGTDAYKTSGYADMQSKTGVKLVNLNALPFDSVRIPKGRKLQRVLFSRIVREADVLINVAKLKTHLLTALTAAVKNTYGFLPETQRKNLHKDFVSSRDFAEAVVDIFSVRPPDLNIVDAVVALEGYGPSSGGAPRNTGFIAAGTDAVAVDAVLGKIIGYRLSEVFTTLFASRRQLGTRAFDKINVAGADFDTLLIKDFKLPHTTARTLAFIEVLPPAFKHFLDFTGKQLKDIPRIQTRRCIGCRLCEMHCPTGAVQVNEGIAEIDYRKCVACFCCQEFCQSNAVTLSHAPLGKVLMGGQKVFEKIKIFFSKRKT